MKYLHWLAIAALPILAASCIKDEAPNIDADITEVTCSDDESMLNVVYRDFGIDIFADPQADLSNITFHFTVSDGATIAPDPATVTDYTEERSFVVTSENGEWQKRYAVRVGFPELPTHFRFENWMSPENRNYRIPYETTMLGGTEHQLGIWACGNAALTFIVGSKSDYTAYPTQPTSNAAEGQYAAKLVTKQTGQPQQPIAAGNLFIGQFNSREYDPLNATKFGLPFTKKPLRFKGMYSYTPGGLTYYSQVEDKCRMQAILYKTDATLKYLNGHTVNADLPNVIARAELPSDFKCNTNGEWRAFDIAFKYNREIDPALLERGGYNLAVIFSASRNGDKYDGAQGSTLCVDDVEIVCE